MKYNIGDICIIGLDHTQKGKTVKIIDRSNDVAPQPVYKVQYESDNNRTGLFSECYLELKDEA